MPSSGKQDVMKARPKDGPQIEFTESGGRENEDHEKEKGAITNEIALRANVLPDVIDFKRKPQGNNEFANTDLISSGSSCSDFEAPECKHPRAPQDLFDKDEIGQSLKNNGAETVINISEGLCENCHRMFETVCRIVEGVADVADVAEDEEDEEDEEDLWDNVDKKYVCAFNFFNSGKAANWGCRVCLLLLQGLCFDWDAPLLGFEGPLAEDPSGEISLKRQHVPTWAPIPDLERETGYTLEITLSALAGLRSATSVVYLFPANKIGKAKADIPISVQKLIEKLETYHSYESQLNNSSQLKLLKKWIEGCSMDHQACKSTEFKLPTRLIYLREGELKLRVVSELTDPPKYATLSHCWGQLDIFRLTKDRLEAFKTKIPWARLCKTFQDAIAIVRQLDLDYLWIDSLCIIQDDQMDWRMESSLMTNVYSGSAINIAAASSQDGNGGCFVQPSPRIAYHPVCLTINTKRHPYILIEEDLYANSVEEQPLIKRGWVLQERLLAPRTIYFNDYHLLWQCREKVYSQAFPIDVPTILILSGGLSMFKAGKDEDPGNWWRAVISRYSGCSITKSKDKLVAISGIARIIQRQTNDEYIAGLWKRSLCTDLHWYTSKPLSTKPSRYRAPSWSWAAVDDAFNFASPITFYIRVLDIGVTLSSHDMFGEISNGYLVLSVMNLLPCTQIGIDAPSGRPVVTVYSIAFTMHIFFDYFLPQSIRDVKNRAYRFLPTGRFHDHTRGLILEPITAARCEYQRVGLFLINDWPDSTAHARFEEFCQEPANNAPELQHAERTVDGEFIIRII